MKEPVRQALHRFGYDVVPLQVEAQEFVRDVLARHEIGLLIDVGANEGQYALGMRRLGFKGRILSFEPMVEAYSALQRQSARDESWTVRRLALGAEPSEALLNVTSNSVSSSLLAIGELHMQAEPTSQAERVEVVTVSCLDEEVGPDYVSAASWLKIDVQGYEAAVLSGARSTLDHCEVVQVELSLRPLYSGQADYLEILGTLRDAGLTPIQFIPGFAHPATGELLQLDVVAARVDGSHKRT